MGVLVTGGQVMQSGVVIGVCAVLSGVMQKLSYDDTSKEILFYWCVLSNDVLSNEQKFRKRNKKFSGAFLASRWLVTRHVSVIWAFFYGNTACHLVILVICVVLSITLYSVVFQR